MKRSDLLSKARTCQILLVSTDKILSEGIQWFQECKWSHAAFMVVLNNEPFLIEAINKGVALTDLAYYINNNSFRLGILKPNFVITLEKEQQVIKFALPLCGRHRYSFRHLLKFQVVRYAWKKLFGKELWIDDSAIISPSWRFICGQLCAYIIHKNFSGMFNEWKEVAPKDLYNSVYFTFEPIED